MKNLNACFDCTMPEGYDCRDCHVLWKPEPEEQEAKEEELIDEEDN